jgi:hypothetical protein
LTIAFRRAHQAGRFTRDSHIQISVVFRAHQ